MKPSSTDLKSPLSETGSQDQRVGLLQRKAGIGLTQCLISSASQTRRNMLTAAASEGGWDSILCIPPDEIGRSVELAMFQFALIDLDQRGSTASGARDLVQELVQASPEVLVGVCGHEADPGEEIWARQLGVWLYLPGVTTSTEMSLLFEQALQIVMASSVSQENTAM